MGEWAGLPQKIQWGKVTQTIVVDEQNGQQYSLLDYGMHGVINRARVWQENLSEEQQGMEPSVEDQKASQPRLTFKQTSQFWLPKVPMMAGTWRRPINMTEMV